MEPGSRRTTNYAFAPVVTRIPNSSSVKFPLGYRNAKVISYNSAMDYAIIEDLSGKNDLTPIPISIQPVEADIDLKVFHLPVGLFTDGGIGDLSVFTKWVKSATPTTHHIPCSGGLYAGSSGGPFVNREGFCVGMHVESINSAEAAPSSISNALVDEAIEIISNTVNSYSNNHDSICRALQLGKCPQLINMLGTTLDIELH
jgi:hypothetical protein